MLTGDIWGGVWGMSGGCLGVSEWYSWKSEALGCVWGVSGFSVLAVWSRNTILAQPGKAHFFKACQREIIKPNDFCQPYSILQGRKTQIPTKHIRAPPISMNTTQISPGHPPGILQTPPRHVQGTKDDNRHQQRQRASPRHPKTLTGAV